MKRFIGNSGKVLTFLLLFFTLAGLGDLDNLNPVLRRFFAELIPFISILLLNFIFPKLFKEKIKAVNLKSGRKALLNGISCGLTILAFTSLMFLSNNIYLERNEKTSYFYIWLISAFLNCIMQELLVRGYLYSLLKEEYGVKPAIFATSLIFTILHPQTFEDSLLAVLNVFSTSLLMSLLYEKTSNIFAPIMAHSIWNIGGGLILGGVNLADDYPSLYTFVVKNNSILASSSSKMEGSILVLIINFVFIFLYQKKLAKNA